MQIVDKSYLENILYILLDEREPVIRDYNSLLGQIQEFKCLHCIQKDVGTGKDQFETAYSFN